MSDSLGPYGSPPASSVMGFSRQEYWCGLLFASPGDLPRNPTMSPALTGMFFATIWKWCELRSTRIELFLQFRDNLLLARVPSLVLVYACCPGIVIYSILYHSQKVFHLDNKLHNHSGDSPAGLTINMGYTDFYLTETGWRVVYRCFSRFPHSW